jgi:hypothetical protein
MTDTNDTEVKTTSEHPFAAFINALSEGFRPEYTSEINYLGRRLLHKTSVLRSEMERHQTDPYAAEVSS